MRGDLCLFVQPFRARCEKVELHRRTYVRIHVQGESMRSMQVRANMKVKLGYRAACA